MKFADINGFDPAIAKQEVIDDISDNLLANPEFFELVSNAFLGERDLSGSTIIKCLLDAWEKNPEDKVLAGFEQEWREYKESYTSDAAAEMHNDPKSEWHKYYMDYYYYLGATYN